eukprot:tig00020825_g14303.t1
MSGPGSSRDQNARRAPPAPVPSSTSDSQEQLQLQLHQLQQHAICLKDQIKSLEGSLQREQRWADELERKLNVTETQARNQSKRASDEAATRRRAEDRAVEFSRRAQGAEAKLADAYKDLRAERSSAVVDAKIAKEELDKARTESRQHQLALKASEAAAVAAKSEQRKLANDLAASRAAQAAAEAAAAKATTELLQARSSAAAEAASAKTAKEELEKAKYQLGLHELAWKTLNSRLGEERTRREAAERRAEEAEAAAAAAKAELAKQAEDLAAARAAADEAKSLRGGWRRRRRWPRASRRSWRSRGPRWRSARSGARRGPRDPPRPRPAAGRSPSLRPGQARLAESPSEFEAAQRVAASARADAAGVDVAGIVFAGVSLAGIIFAGVDFAGAGERFGDPAGSVSLAHAADFSLSTAEQHPRREPFAPRAAASIQRGPGAGGGAPRAPERHPGIARGRARRIAIGQPAQLRLLYPELEGCPRPVQPAPALAALELELELGELESTPVRPARARSEAPEATPARDRPAPAPPAAAAAAAAAANSNAHAERPKRPRSSPPAAGRHRSVLFAGSEPDRGAPVRVQPAASAAASAASAPLASPAVVQEQKRRRRRHSSVSPPRGAGRKLDRDRDAERERERSREERRRRQARMSAREWREELDRLFALELEDRTRAEWLASALERQREAERRLADLEERCRRDHFPALCARLLISSKLQLS